LKGTLKSVPIGTKLNLGMYL